MSGSRVFHFLLKMPALLALLFALGLGFISLAAQPGQAFAAVAAPGGKTIDWKHPVRVQPLAKRSGLASDLASGVIPEPVSSSAGLRPNANFPSNCLNNYAYYMGYNGEYTWIVGHPTKAVQASVSYMWCPRWQGDSIGINWAYGRDYALSGCRTMLIGNHHSSGLGWYGAAIMGNQASANDGETNSTYTVCNSYAWDDSMTVPGNYTYTVVMLFKDTVGDQFDCISPTF